MASSQPTRRPQVWSPESRGQSSQASWLLAGNTAGGSRVEDEPEGNARNVASILTEKALDLCVFNSSLKQTCHLTKK